MPINFRGLGKHWVDLYCAHKFTSGRARNPQFKSSICISYHSGWNWVCNSQGCSIYQSGLYSSHEVSSPSPSPFPRVRVRVPSHVARVRVRVTSHHALEIHFSVLKFHCVDTYLLFLTATCTCTEIQRVGNKEVLKAISVTCMVVRYFQKSALKKEHPHWKSTFRPLTSCWQQNTLHYTSHQHWSKCLLQENVSSMDSNDHVVLFSKPMQVHVFQNCFTL